MKLQILSDQHIEFKKNFNYFNNRCHARADTLIIAGDLCPHKDLLREKCIHSQLLRKWKNVLVIPGNHEFYDSNSFDPFFGSKEEVYSNEKGNTCQYVNNKSVEINGTIFLCTTLWSYVDPIKAFEIECSLNDYKQISGLKVDTMNEYHQRNKDWLEEAIKEVPDNKRCIVVSHHVPSYNFISERWRGNPINDAFSADMDVFIMKYGHKISHWIHGHSHDALDKSINGTRFIRNPMGYPHERDVDMDMVIEV